DILMGNLPVDVGGGCRMPYNTLFFESLHLWVLITLLRA
ncbi:uncharacterized protein METZ01_LOCUS479586, partial [marine metagenome]